MKKICLVSTIITISVLLNACLVINQTKNQLCPSHCNNNHILTGKTAIVKAHYGKLDSSFPHYPYAKAPHSMGCLIPLWPAGRWVKIYVCDSCTYAYKLKIKRQKNNQKPPMDF